MTHRNYKVALEGRTLTELHEFNIDSEDRPRVGHQIKIPGRLEIFHILRTIPKDNPSNAQVTYVVTFQDDLDLISKDNKFEQFFVRNAPIR